MGQTQALLGVVVIAGSWGAFVECHHDVCTNTALDIHYPFWREEMFRTIDMTGEIAAFLLQFSNTGKREYLETTAVCQHRTVPADEAV